jgi:Tfp pilus assembly protein PilF
MRTATRSGGGAYLFKNDYERALADFTKQIEIDPDNAEAYRGRSAAYGGKYDNDAALADNNKAIELTKQRLEKRGLRPQ